jgi:hypothetical protein
MKTLEERLAAILGGCPKVMTGARGARGAA